MDDTSVRFDESESVRAAHACSCNQPSVYLRANEGRHYCGRCLSRQIERQFAKTIGKNNMLEKGDTVAVGVSGGKDSMVLLHLLYKFSKKMPVKLIAVTVDEGIAGYRDKSIEVVEKFVKTIGVEHHVFSFCDEFDFKIDNLSKEEKFCTYCGVFRRYMLNKAAREVGATKLAIGHNLDDEAQSIMMNVLRGDMTRMKRLSPKPQEKLVPRIKPLKNIPEKEIVVYALMNSIPYFDGECPNSFNNTRRDVQTMINNMESKYPGTKHQIVNFYRKIRPVLKEKPGTINYCVRCGEPASQQVCKACGLLERAKKENIAHKI